MGAQLLYGDCLDLLPNLPSASVDMVLCDLPYGRTACSWDKIIPMKPLWKQYLRIAKPNAAIVLMGAQPFTSALVMSNSRIFRSEWIWEKGNATGFLNAKKQQLRAHESVLVFYKKQPVFNPQMTTGHQRKVTRSQSVNSECYGEANSLRVYDSTDRYPRSVLFFSSDKQKCNLHPTQKPVALMEYLIKTYSNEGFTVLDNAMGSGSTGVACANTGRHFIGIEKDPTHFATAKARMEGL